MRLVALLLFLVLFASGCLCGNGATVCPIIIANSSFDWAIQNSSWWTWIAQHYNRMLVYAPAFDADLSWFPGGWAYKDMYSIIPGSSVATQHPDWILRDASGSFLYIPYACSGGTCTQYAGDIGNPSFRANWISEAQGMMRAGYKGMFLDDFNMRMQVGNGSGNLVTPIDRRTGQAMTTDAWRSYMADFVTEIRTAFPIAELVENQVYFFAPATDPNVIRATKQADYVWIERAFNDGGLVGGSGTFGFETLLAFIDQIHMDGVGTIEEIQTSSQPEYALACYFLTSTGGDGLSDRYTQAPGSWWSGNDVNLGSVRSLLHYRWNGLYRRDFTRGMVLVNEPGSPTVTANLGGSYTRLDGTVVSSVTIGAGDGVVLRR